MLRQGILATFLWSLCLVGAADGIANEKQDANRKAGSDARQAPACHKRIRIRGRPHRISAVASLSAVRFWSQQAMKHGDTYGMWHNAVGSSVKCERLPRSDYYVCFAIGKPCRSSESETSSSTN